jgi:hypothetical protein
MIASAVGAIILEKCITETLVFRKLGIGLKDLPLLKNVGKTAITSLIAGAVTYVVYSNAHAYLMQLGEQLAADAFGSEKLSTLDFIGGGLVLGVCACVFAPIYLLAANFWGLVEESEKQAVKNMIRRLVPGRTVPIAEPR